MFSAVKSEIIPTSENAPVPPFDKATRSAQEATAPSPATAVSATEKMSDPKAKAPTGADKKTSDPVQNKKYQPTPDEERVMETFASRKRSPLPRLKVKDGLILAQHEDPTTGW